MNVLTTGVSLRAKQQPIRIESDGITRALTVLKEMFEAQPNIRQSPAKTHLLELVSLRSWECVMAILNSL